MKAIASATNGRLKRDKIVPKFFCCCQSLISSGAGDETERGGGQGCEE